MKKSLALILVIILMFSMAAEVFADSNTQKAEPVLLTGQFGEEETIRIRQPAGSATPFYLDKPVKQCKHVRLSLSIEEEETDCAGYYYLYAMDFDGKWEHISTFKVAKKRVNGNAYNYEIDLDHRSDFVALALWTADKLGRSFAGYFKYSAYVDPSCITEYSDKIPEPIFEPSDVTEQYIDLSIASLDQFQNPWSPAATNWFFNH